MCIALGAATHCPSSLPHHLSPSGCRLCTEERPLSTLHSLMNRGLRCCRQFVACRAAGRLQPPGARLRTCGRSDQRRYTTPHLWETRPAMRTRHSRGACACAGWHMVCRMAWLDICVGILHKRAPSRAVGRRGVVGYHIRLTRERSPVRSWTTTFCVRRYVSTTQPRTAVEGGHMHQPPRRLSAHL